MFGQAQQHNNVISFGRLRPFLTQLVILAIPGALLSQTNTGRILGTVQDVTLAKLVNATLTVTDVQRNVSRVVTTNGTGDYTLSELPPGKYIVRAESKDLKTVERRNIELLVASEVRIDFTLPPGDKSETITVNTEVPMVNTINDVMGGALSNKTINQLPLNGRDFENLVVLRPGVMRYPGGGLGSISANGVRPEDNNYVIDGIDNNDSYFGQPVMNGAGVQGTPATLLPIDAIQEFNAEQSVPAEYGWKPGAVINIGLKSGTNSFHGSTYYFGRNDVLDARNFFNDATDPKKPLRMGQFGSTLGGPIYRQKAFFFFAYEGVRELVGVTQEVPSPVTASMSQAYPLSPNCKFIGSGDCANSIPDAIADLRAGGVAVSPLSLKLLPLFPANAGANPSGPNVLSTGFPNTNRNDNGVAKIDYHINDRHSLSGIYLIGDGFQKEQDQPVLQQAWESEAKTRAQVSGLNWFWTPNAKWVNEAKMGVNRLNKSVVTADSTVSPAVYGINTGVTNPMNFGMPQISISGFLPTGGNSGWPQLVVPAQTLQFADNAAVALGAHALKFGGEVRRSSVDQAKDRLGKGRLRFGYNGVDAFTGATPLEDFLAGVPSDGRLFLGNSFRQVSFWSYAAFVQDDWHLSHNVSLNLGLRYELNTVIRESNNLLGNFDPALGLIQVGKQVQSPYNGDHNNFGPRFGISWDPTGSGKTVIRAGSTVSYEVPPLNTFIGQFNVNNDPGTIGINVVPTGANGVTPLGGTIKTGVQYYPAGTLNWSTAGPVFPTSTLSCTISSPCDVFAVDRKLRTPFVTSWNINVEHEFKNNLALQVAYVGNHGSRLYGIRDINQIQNQSAAEIACGHCENNSDRPFGAAFPYLGFINQLSSTDRSNYNGLQATLSQRFFRSVSFLIGYTYSHSLDDASDNRAPQAMDGTRPGLEYGSSDFDIRHRLTASLTYDLPSRKGSWGQLLQGWQLNSIVTLQGGQPWNIVDTGNDISGTAEGSDRWNFFGNPSDFSVSPSSGIPWYPSGTTAQNGNAPAIDVPGCLMHAQVSQLLAFGCFMKGSSVMTPPDAGTFGSMGRNIFRGPGLRNLDVSLVKNWQLSERFDLQLRGEVFNALNHPTFANPYGVNGTFFQVDPSSPQTFGCACATPDVAEANPVIGTGGPRNIQFGLKVVF